MNTIANLKTMSLQSADGPVHAIVMGLNIRDLESSEAFIAEACEKFKLQRMCSPPDTSVSVISIMTEMPASAFARRWREIGAKDQILTVFMSMMKRADVVRGTAAGEILETVSLIEGASEADGV